MYTVVLAPLGMMAVGSALVPAAIRGLLSFLAGSLLAFPSDTAIRG